MEKHEGVTAAVENHVEITAAMTLGGLHPKGSNGDAAAEGTAA